MSTKLSAVAYFELYEYHIAKESQKVEDRRTLHGAAPTVRTIADTRHGHRRLSRRVTWREQRIGKVCWM